MTYPLASEQDLLEMLAEVNDALDRMDAADVVNYERWFNRRETLLDQKRAIVADLERVKEAA